MKNQTGVVVIVVKVSSDKGAAGAVSRMIWTPTFPLPHNAASLRSRAKMRKLSG